MAVTTAGDDGTNLVARLFGEYQAAVFAYIWRLVRNREWAEDLTQETFLRVFDARDRLPEVANHRAWLYRIATNTALNALRRRRRFAWLPWGAAHTLGWGEPDVLTKIAQRDAVEAALVALPPNYRAPLLLYSHYGFSIGEVAEALETSEGAVKTRLYRAREMFRQAYERESLR
jgi:RNA polymerase sigma-70 factor (ECF subfamily)